MLEFVIISALCVAGLLFCLNKWGFLTTYQVYRKRWMPPADCYFCISFQLYVLPCILLAVISSQWDYVVAPLAIATLSAFICTVIIQPTDHERN